MMMISRSRLPVPLPTDTPPGIYVHVPFCRHVCPYCDFNTYAGQESLMPAYVEAVLAEMRQASPSLVRLGPPSPSRRGRLGTNVSPSSPLFRVGEEARGQESPTLFFGGGTPSLLPPADIARIIAAARELYGLVDDAEVTLEANPESLTMERLRDLRAAGVNRLSLGVQSQQRAGLRVLGRGHGSLQAGAAFRAARDAGFDNVSLDFIFGWPGQRAEDWDADLATILDWEPEHVSLYALIVEPGTPMHGAVARGILNPLDDDAAADLYDRAVATLGAAGWEHYEIANWAREPRYRSRHNQLYWQNGAYHGFGAGAHGRLGATRASNLLRPEKYIAAVREGASPRALAEELSPATQAGESMLLGLRLLRDGVSARDFAARHGVDLRERYASEIARFASLGLLTWRDDRLVLTEHGALLANDVCAAFLP